MKLRINNIKLPLEHDVDEVFQRVKKILHIPNSNIKNMQIVRRSVDAREKTNIVFVYSVEVEVEKLPQKIPSKATLVQEEKSILVRGTEKLKFPPVIVGAGPAGLFAAWKLAEWGYKPVIIERGKDILSRHADVVHFWEKGELNPESNVQFGEGGAGTFSDGKLTARTKDYRINEVFEILVACGAPQEIMYLNKPHIGTDLLRKVIVNMRNQIVAWGGRIFFEACLTDIGVNSNTLKSIEINRCIELPVELCVMAPGHSARDTYAMLAKRQLTLQAKPFAVGVRIEHHQDYINRIQHGEFAGHPKLGPADYMLTYQDKATGRGVFSFCMCPGGYVVAAASEEGGVVTNGMSEHARDTAVANSALVVSVTPEDFPGEGPLSGIDFQRMLEKKAYEMGGKNYFAPACDAKAFVEDTKELTKHRYYPSYRPGVEKANLRDLLPKEIGEALANALKHFDNLMSDWNTEAVLTGVESRTSAPLRILRNEEMQSPDALGLYPVGEGAGYAGGIVSAAIDGLKAAEKIISVYLQPKEDFSKNDLAKIREMD